MGDDVVGQACDAQKQRHIVQGKVGVTDAPDVVFTTVLGASVLACLHDAGSGVGGAAHFQFPGGDAGHDTRFGGAALGQLIQDLLARGADHSRLVAQIFGGAKVHDARQDIGQSNIAFALQFLADQGVRVAAKGIGGEEPRRVRFTPSTGVAVDSILNEGF